MKLSYKSHYERSYLKMYCSMVTFGLPIPKCHYGKRGTLMTRRRFVVPTTDRKCSIYYRGKRNGIFLPGDARVRFGKVGLAHESNGQRKPDSRSWNYVYFGGAAEWGRFIWESTWKQRINEPTDDDNPDLIRYQGNFENRISWRDSLSTYSITRINRELSWDKGSWQIDFTHPVNSNKPDGLRFYIQFFSGYGETLLDYNHRQNRIGFGFLILNI